jgi:murein DD-endopeptidase MepM/ murein hydrolase activator NlpD
MKKIMILGSFVIGLVVLGSAYLVYRGGLLTNDRSRQVIAFIRNPSSRESMIIPAGTRCGDAPFTMPTTGMIGFIWGDSFRIGHQHSGIDIFSGTEAGVTPVYAAYDGYLSRLEDWKSSLIIRIPSNPLNPDQQIWTYYTHMADPSGMSFIVDDFPPGTRNLFVHEGTLLGYQGNYSGTSGNPTGVHLHFSIVKDDGEGGYLNELEIGNTLDPTPYFGLSLNASENPKEIPICRVN